MTDTAWLWRPRQRAPPLPPRQRTIRRCLSSYEHMPLPPRPVQFLPAVALAHPTPPPTAADHPCPAAAPAKWHAARADELFEWELERGIRRGFVADTLTARAVAGAHARGPTARHLGSTKAHRPCAPAATAVGASASPGRTARPSSRSYGGCGVGGIFADLKTAVAAASAACQRCSVQLGWGGRQWATERPSTASWGRSAREPVRRRRHADGRPRRWRGATKTHR